MYWSCCWFSSPRKSFSSVEPRVRVALLLRGCACRFHPTLQHIEGISGGVGLGQIIAQAVPLIDGDGGDQAAAVRHLAGCPFRQITSFRLLYSVQKLKSPVESIKPAMGP